jgi:hypothetical protein
MRPFRNALRHPHSTLIHLAVAPIHPRGAITHLPKWMQHFLVSLTHPDPRETACPYEIDEHAAGIPRDRLSPNQAGRVMTQDGARLRQQAREMPYPLTAFRRIECEMVRCRDAANRERFGAF